VAVETEFVTSSDDLSWHFGVPSFDLSDEVKASFSVTKLVENRIERVTSIPVV
jgi:hypothetical protein